MKILTIYSPEDSGFIRIWERSWSAYGWKPGLISPKELQGQSVRSAAKARRAKRVISVRALNYGQRPWHGNFHIKAHGAPGWKTARIVLFPPSMTEEQIRTAREA